MSHGKSQKGKISEKGKILTHERTLEVLSEMAENGSVTAAAALERALRAQQREENDDLDREFERLVSKK